MKNRDLEGVYDLDPFKKRFIHSNDLLKFGKYYWDTLSQVCEKDPGYVTWLVKNTFGSNVYELNNVNYWVDVYKDINNIIPHDGLYVMAIVSDNHMEYDLKHFTKGTDLNDVYKLDTLTDKDLEHCVGYNAIPQYTPNNERWKYTIGGRCNDRPCIWAIKEDGIIYYGWAGSYFGYDSEKEGHLCCTFQVNNCGEIVTFAMGDEIGPFDAREFDIGIEFLGKLFITDFTNLLINHSDYLVLKTEELKNNEKV